MYPEAQAQNLWIQTFHQSYARSADVARSIEDANTAVAAFKVQFQQEVA